MDEDILTGSRKTYKVELSNELWQILKYWIDHTPDTTYGGFYPQIDNYNQVNIYAPKGSVLNSRILWSFSAAYQLEDDTTYLNMAHRAYQYIIDHFIDKEYGGVYWLVDYKGNKLDTKKQVYAIAFTIYALSEYFLASGLTDARDLAIELYCLLVDKAYDKTNTGYFEAFCMDWQPIDDLRLSAKDENEKKTMNTHLHVLEAYTNLYKIWPDEGLKTQIETLLCNFETNIINNETKHLILFLDENWNQKSDAISYGHDIEASWLLLEAAEVIKDEALIKRFKIIALAMADHVFEGVDHDGALYYEYEPQKNHLITEKHWWVQAEAMVGFYNAWQISNNPKYLDASINNWDFVKSNILDKQNGEWFWGVYADGSIMATEDKIGVWKCPYHNSRACMEIIKRSSATKH